MISCGVTPFVRVVVEFRMLRGSDPYRSGAQFNTALQPKPKAVAH